MANGTNGKNGTNGNKSNYVVNANTALSAEKHDELLEYLIKKLDDQRIFHDSQTARYKIIDKNIYGYLRLDEDDKKRKVDNERGYGIKPTDTSIPVVISQVRDATTFMKEVLSDNDRLYNAIAPSDKQPVATAFSSLMNEHADKFKHEKEIYKFLVDGMKYNFGVISPEWYQNYGNKISNGVTTGAISIQNEVVYAGNKLTSLDVYNLWYDLSVDPIEISTQGEWFCNVEAVSPFRVKKDLADGKLFNCQDIVDKDTYSLKYFTPKPSIRSNTELADAGVDWLTLLGGIRSSTSTDKVVEKLNFCIWLDLNYWGLNKAASKTVMKNPKNKADKSNYAICRVRILNQERIVSLEVLNNAHGMLPICITMPIEDGFRQDTKSFAELLMPFQMFISFQFNIHQKAARRALYGILFYNKQITGEISEQYDPIASKVGLDLPPEADINKAIKQVFDAPNTENTMRDIESVNALMQKILPTELLKQVANLQRATEYQAAATVQAGSKTALDIAKVINAQAFSPMKHIQMYNILQYQQTIEILAPNGQLMQVSPAKFRGTRLEFTISEGLKGLDKLALMTAMKDVLNSILQNVQAAQQIDVVKLIDHITSLIGDQTSFEQFKIQSPLDNASPQEKQLAFQLLQQYAQQQQQGGQTGQQNQQAQQPPAIPGQ